jgi:hypothetical protein
VEYPKGIHRREGGHIPLVVKVDEKRELLDWDSCKS